MLSRIKYRSFLIRLFNWEYWPVYVSNIPVFIFWMYYAIRSGSLLFFTRVNPGIPTSGLFGESKWKILNLIPEKYLPKAIFIKGIETGEPEKIHHLMQDAGIDFPCIIKPDVGERGRGVERLPGPDSLKVYLEAHRNTDLIIQEYIDLPLEYSVMCFRLPDMEKAGITSICKKAFLTVTGDGRSTLKELIQASPRSLLQLNMLQQKLGANIETVPEKDQEILLEPIGNHCRGTMFINCNHFITADVEEQFLSMLSGMHQVHYGRFDIRVKSKESLHTGLGLKVFEFNGVGSEPAHVYDPDYKAWRAYADFLSHWKILYQIARNQKRKGVKTTPLKHFRSMWLNYRSHVRRVSIASRNFPDLC